MSPTKLKSLLTGAFFAIIIALSSSVVASDLRLWKPYSPESFGGGRRTNDGVYGSVSGIYWSFSTPKGGYIGATNSKGNDETRWVYNLETGVLREQTNTLNVEMMGTTTTLGTRFEVGNRRGHHGWLVSGYGLPGQTHRLIAQNVSLVIRDEGIFSAPPDSPALPGQVGYLWGQNFGVVRIVVMENQGQANPPPAQAGWTPWFEGPADQVPTPVSANWDPIWHNGIWYRWEPNVASGQEYYFPTVGEEPGPAMFAPLPIVFDNVDISVRSEHRSAEVMYTHRLHPFTWGSMELLAGARYWDFDDKFRFNGANVLSVGADGRTTTYGPIRAFEDMRIEARGRNCVVGPQVGIKLRRHNARWTFGAEGRFTAGINAQTVKTEGHITPHRDYQPIGTQTATVDLGNRSNNVSFGHKQTKTYFSPVLEGSLSADWQWTSAISFFGAVNGMFADNIARGVRVTDYVVSNGQIFGIRGNDRNTHVFVYGVEAGIKVNR